MTRPGVAFLSLGGFHRVVLQPIHEAVDGRIRSRVVANVPEAVQFEPSVIVVPSHRHLERLRRRLPGVWLVNARHGLIAKRGLEELPDRPSARRFDAVVFGDQWSEERYRAHGAAPQEAWHTGYPQMDDLFRAPRGPSPGIDFPDGIPIVLYAPTWNRGLSSAPMLGRRVAELIRGTGRPVGLIIKPHPTTPKWRPEWLQWWQEAARSDPLVHLADAREDVTRLMRMSDVLVSDASSTIFEFLALDRPIVLVTNPEATRDPGYDPNDLPWRWRDVGDEVRGVAEIATAVRTALDHPWARSVQRRDYRDVLFGAFQDGRNTARLADRLVDLVGRIEEGVAPPALRFSIPPSTYGAAGPGGTERDDDEEPA